MPLKQRSTSFRQTMASLHGWAGLLAGWMGFVIFLFGTAAYFQQEISCWMRPEINGSAVTREALDAVYARLSAAAPDAQRWEISMPSQRSGDPFYVSWKPRAGTHNPPGSLILDPATGEDVLPRDTQGGWFLYLLHFDFHYMPTDFANLLVSIAALAMLVTLLSGILTHRRLFADFFTLRLGKGHRSWLDAHNLAGVVALPFHMMIVYTGLVALLFTLMPWAITANFQSEPAFHATSHVDHPEPAASGRSAPMLPLSALVERVGIADLVRGGAYVSIDHPGDVNATVTINREPVHIGADRRRLHLSAVTGAPLWREPESGIAAKTLDTMIDLHTGLFAGPVLRWLYFISGIAGTLMIASGLVLWTTKRRARLPDPLRPPFGFRLVERLNIAVIIGGPAGIAAYFLANRVLPTGMPHRADWEMNMLFVAWGGIIVWTLARPARQSWVEGLALCGGLYVLAPITNALTTTRGLVPSMVVGDWVFAGFDLVMLASAVVFAMSAWKVAIRKPERAPRKRRLTVAPAA